MKQMLIMCLFCVIFTLVPAAFSAAQDEQEGNATWYDTETLGMNARHARLPRGTRVRVTNLENGKQVDVTINNSMPPMPDRILDISREAAKALEMAESGATPIRIEILDSQPSDPSEEIVSQPEPPEYPVRRPAAASAQPTPPPTPTPPPPPPPPPPGSRPVPAAAQRPAAAEPPSAGSVPLDITIKMIITVNGQEHTMDIPVMTDVKAAERQEPDVAGPASSAFLPDASTVRIVPQMPDPRGGGKYRVQLGAFSSTNLAQGCFDRLKAAGLSPAFERHDNLYRVVISGIQAAEIPRVAQRLGSAGFKEAWIREEK
jgi:rare lipoprotein A